MTATDIILFIFAIANGLIAVSNFIGGKRKNGSDEGQQSGIILTNLDNIKNSLQEIKTDVKDLKKNQSDYDAKLAKLEASCENAHEQIQQIFNLINVNKKEDNK